MATHDYVIANQSGAAFRTDLNNALAAIVSNNSNSSEPATKYAYQWWADTSAAVMKLRNSANDGWIELFQLDGTLTLEDGSATAPGLAFRDDLNTGIFSSAADHIGISAGGEVKLTLNGENEIASVSFDLSRKSLNIECTCTKGNFCHPRECLDKVFKLELFANCISIYVQFPSTFKKFFQYSFSIGSCKFIHFLSSKFKSLKGP